MLASGDHLWNAGIFLFAAKDLIAAFEALAPDVLAAVRPAVAAAEGDLGFLRLSAEAWDAAPDISIDYAIMERAGNLSVVPYDSGWSDLGEIGRASCRERGGQYVKIQVVDGQLKQKKN